MKRLRKKVKNEIKGKLKNNFIKKCEIMYGEEFDLSKIAYVNNKTKVLIGCKKHGYFEVTPLNFLHGHKCPKCSKYSNRYTTQEWVEKAKQIHGNKYDYSRAEYISANDKVCIICPEHGEFWQKPSNHLNGFGCAKCKIKKLAQQNFNKAKENFIEKVNKVHNYKYDYSLVDYKGNDELINVICKKHGVFQITPHNHLKGNGCHNCSKSLGENKIAEILTSKNITFEREKKFSWLIYKGNLRLDFYLPIYNIGIEFQGRGHYFPVNWAKKCEGWAIDNLKIVQERDERKRSLCVENNVKLFYINYDENVEDKLNKILKEITQ